MRSAKKGRHGAALRDNGAPLSFMMLQKRSGCIRDPSLHA